MKISLGRSAALLCALLVLFALPFSVAAHPDDTVEWGSFRGTGGSAVVDTATPLDTARQQWAFALKGADEWDKAVSDPLMVNGQLYIAVGSELLVISRSGELTEKGSLAAPIDYTCRPLYTGGNILVPLSGGRLQALAADSLETVWITESLPEHEGLAHQSLSTLVESDGYVYFGTACADWTTSYYGLFLCVEAATGDIVWQHENTEAGYYWSGAAILNGAALVAGDDGVLTALDARTGAVLDRLALGAPVRATTVSDGNHVLLVSTDGRLHRVAVGEDGHLGEHRSVAFASSSTGTPAVHDGKAYVGGAQADYTGVFCVIDLAKMTVERTAALAADVKSAPLLSTAHAGGVAAYFTSNALPGGIHVLRPDAAEAALLFSPETADQNYCMTSIMAGPDGTLYYTNDSGKLFAVAGGTTGGQNTTVSSSETTAASVKVSETSPDTTETTPSEPATGEVDSLPFLLMLTAGSAAATLLTRRSCHRS